MTAEQPAIVTNDAPEMLGAALALAGRGFPVFPLYEMKRTAGPEAAHGAICACDKPAAPPSEVFRTLSKAERDSYCDRPGKHPRTEHGHKEATIDTATIRRWWERWPDANIGLATGGPGRVVVLDVDPKGFATLDGIEAEHSPLPPTLTARTGRGEHRYFTVPEHLDIAPVRPRAHHVGPGLDQRGPGGYVVAPPSVHANEAVYTWVDTAAPLAALPGWLYKLMTREKERAAPPAPPAPAAPRREATAGVRPDAFTRAVLALSRFEPSIQGQNGSGKLAYAADKLVHGFELSDYEAYRALYDSFNPRCVPPWSEKELRHAITNMRANGRGRATRGDMLDAERPRPAAPRDVESADTAPDDDAGERATIEANDSAEDAPPSFDPSKFDAPPGTHPSPDPPPKSEQPPPNVPPSRDKPGSEAPPRSAFEWIGVAGIFAPLPETPWISRELQICHGRPAMLAGYGASGKTLALQSLALSVATDEKIWSQFRVRKPLRVRHVDHEQGQHATRGRYQRLARGLGISADQLAEAEQGGRLAIASFPSVYLNRSEAEDIYCRAFEGVDLVIIDALRGATPGMDENDSKIRDCIDTLTRVSERTGAAFFLIHHAGKPKEQHSDARTVLRGSSAIFDACGSVFVMAGAKNEPKLVRHEKAAAESTGGMLEDFYLAIDDVLPDGSPAPDSVRLTYRTREQIRPPRSPDADACELRAKILEAVRSKPGVAGKEALASLVHKRRADISGIVDQLLADGVMIDRPVRGKPRYYVAAATDADG